MDERRGHGYISNSIRSSRYTLWDFLPKQIIFQATRLHNAFFICIGVPQTIPGLSTVGRWTTIAPLAVFVAFSMSKEGWDDYRRYRLDKSENRSTTMVLNQGDAAQRRKDHLRRIAEKLKRGEKSKEKNKLSVDEVAPRHGTPRGGEPSTPTVGTPIKLAPSASAFRRPGVGAPPVAAPVPHTPLFSASASNVQASPSKGVLGQVSDLIFGW